MAAKKVTKAQLEQYLQNPNVQKMLGLISYTEGTQKYGAATAFGGGQLGSLKDHPRYRKEFKQTDGTVNKTSAAGKYQFLESTWDGVAKQYGLNDFGPRNQDLAAVALLVQRDAMPALLKGDFSTAVQKTGAEWASLPTAPASYKQSKKSWEKVNKFLGGDYANTTDLMGNGEQQATDITNLFPMPTAGIVPPQQNLQQLPDPQDLISSIFKSADMVGYSKAGEQTPILNVDGKLAAPENEKEFNMFSQIASMGLSPTDESAKAKAASLIAKAQQGVLAKPLIERNPLIPGLEELFKTV